MLKPQDVLNFRFKEIDSTQQFSADPQFDQMVREKFLGTYRKVMDGETASWRETPEGRLAEIIVLDQFSRNMFRDQAEAFAGDPMALALAKEALQLGVDEKLPKEQRAFLYLPFMHSEKKEEHEMAMKLFSQPGLESNFKFEVLHKKIIDRFGRYPHRNQALGRKSTSEEIDFLKEKGSSF